MNLADKLLQQSEQQEIKQPAWIVKKLRRLFNRCPYCKAKLLDGLGGHSLLFLGGMKVCPNKHYAEELHYTGATLIYDNNGKLLNIRGFGE